MGMRGGLRTSRLRAVTHLRPGGTGEGGTARMFGSVLPYPSVREGRAFRSWMFIFGGQGLERTGQGRRRAGLASYECDTAARRAREDRASDLSPVHPFIRRYKHDGQFSISEPYPTRSDHELPPQSVRSKYFRVYHRLEDKATGISYTEMENPFAAKQARQAPSSLGQKHSVPPISPQRCKQACSKREKSPRQNPWVVTSSPVRGLCFCRFVVSKRGGAGATVGRSETSSVYAARSVPGSCRIRGWPTGWIRFHQGRKSYWYTRPPTNPCKSPP